MPSNVVPMAAKANKVATSENGASPEGNMLTKRSDDDNFQLKFLLLPSTSAVALAVSCKRQMSEVDPHQCI